jgi:hypothetical protein
MGGDGWVNLFLNTLTPTPQPVHHSIINSVFKLILAINFQDWI